MATVVEVRVNDGRLVESETEHGLDRRMFGEFVGSAVSV